MSSPQETKLGDELRQLVSGQPFAPDVEAIGRRARQQRRRGLALRGATAAGAAVFLAGGGLFAAVHGTGGTAAGTSAASGAHAVNSKPAGPAASQAAVLNPKLVTLAAYVKASSGNLPGNASLVIQTDVGAPSPGNVTYNLFTDSGAYYGANNKSGITTAVLKHDNQAGNWLDARQVVGAARYAATGNLTTARQRMLNATPQQSGQFERLLSDGPAARKKLWDKLMAKNRAILKAKHAWPLPVPTVKALKNDINYEIWYNSINALTEGAGNPQVREGVLRVLSTIPEVTVANSTTDGRPTLALTAAPALMGAGLPAQVVTISARTGMPISLVNGTPGNRVYSDTTYRVTRVQMARVRAGRW